MAMRKYVYGDNVIEQDASIPVAQVQALAEFS